MGLSDFGLSRELKRNALGYKSEGEMGLERVQAPEVLANKPYQHASDVYSFGIVLWELFSHREAFLEFLMGHRMLNLKIRSEDLRPSQGQIPTEPYALMKKCWHPSTVMRPNVEEITR